MAYTDPNFMANFMRVFAPQAAQQAPGAAAAPAAVAAVPPAQDWITRFQPALQFANALGTQMAAAGGNQVGAGIGQYNAQMFDRADSGRSALSGFGTGQTGTMQTGLPQPQQPMAMPGAPGQTSPVDYRSYFGAPSPLAQTQIGGAPLANPTIPPTGATANPAGGYSFFDYAGFDPNAWSQGARTAVIQNEDARRAAVFNPEMENAMRQLELQRGMIDYQRALNPLPELGRVGNQVYKQDPITGQVTVEHVAPQETQIRSSGRQTLSVDPNTGGVSVLHTSPRDEPQGSWVQAGTDASGNVLLMNPTTGDTRTGGQAGGVRNLQEWGIDEKGRKLYRDARSGETVVGGLATDPTKPKVGLGPNASAVRARVAQDKLQKLRQEYTNLSTKLNAGEIPKAALESTIKRMGELQPQIEELSAKLSTLTPEGNFVDTARQTVTIPPELEKEFSQFKPDEYAAALEWMQTNSPENAALFEQYIQGKK